MRATLRKVTQRGRLRAYEAVALMRVGIMFAVAELAVRTTSVHRVARLFRVELSFADPHPPPAADYRVALTELERLSVWAVRRLSPRFYGPSRGCLRRSLVLGRVLRRFHPIMRVGAQRRENETFIHAWVDIDGHRLDADPTLLPFLSA